MTKAEFEQTIAALATKACDLRCDLEELNQEVQDEALYADRKDDEEMWSNWKSSPQRLVRSKKCSSTSKPARSQSIARHRRKALCYSLFTKSTIPWS